MKSLFTINPIIEESKKNIIIYGCGQDSLRIFIALLQQGINVSHFAAKKSQPLHIKRIFGRVVLRFDELANKTDSYIIISGKSAVTDEADLRKIGAKDIIVENITSDAIGILVDDE